MISTTDRGSSLTLLLLLIHIHEFSVVLLSIVILLLVLQSQANIWETSSTDNESSTDHEQTEQIVPIARDNT